MSIGLSAKTINMPAPNAADQWSTALECGAARIGNAYEVSDGYENIRRKDYGEGDTGR